jgi:hypothetical protein
MDFKVNNTIPTKYLSCRFMPKKSLWLRLKQCLQRKEEGYYFIEFVSHGNYIHEIKLRYYDYQKQSSEVVEFVEIEDELDVRDTVSISEQILGYYREYEEQ